MFTLLVLFVSMLKYASTKHMRLSLVWQLFARKSRYKADKHTDWLMALDE